MVTLNDYVSALTEMLENEYREPCIHCPMEEYECSMNMKEKDQFCDYCQSFVKLVPLDDPPDWGDHKRDINPKCPCARPNGWDPIERAWFYLEKHERNQNLTTHQEIED